MNDEGRKCKQARQSIVSQLVFILSQVSVVDNVIHKQSKGGREAVKNGKEREVRREDGENKNK